MFYFTCPVCGLALHEDEKSAHCKNGHTFDRGKPGYLNLLIRTKKSGGNHGDNKQMVLSRKKFLRAGYYQPLLDRLCETADNHTGTGGTLLDSGCGEGYYTQALYHTLKEKQVTAAGIDISKTAVASAAKAAPAVHYAVASAFDIPVAEESCSTVTAVFSPLCREEFLRILKPHGILILVIPLEKHLWSLKKAVYDRPYENVPAPVELEGFTFLERSDVRGQIRLESNEVIQDLFAMTPYYYKTSEKDQQKLCALTQLETEVEFGILTYRKA